MNFPDRLDLSQALPPWLRSLLSLGLTISAAVLYAGVLGIAIVRTWQEPDPAFSSTMVRAASVLSGLVGGVVAAGFSQSRRQVPIQVKAQAPDDPSQEVTWTTYRPVSLFKRNFLGLGRTLGMPVFSLGLQFSSDDEEPALPPEEAIREPAANKLVMGVALLYFVIYFVVGVAAFALTLLRPTVPEIISNAGWVWLGTVATAGYSFFALDSQA